MPENNTVNADLTDLLRGAAEDLEQAADELQEMMEETDEHEWEIRGRHVAADYKARAVDLRAAADGKYDAASSRSERELDRMIEEVEEE